MSKAEQLLRRAQDSTSLTDFGDDAFREGLEVLVDSVLREAKLTAGGMAGFEVQIVDLLSIRLNVEDWYRRHPEIDAQRIAAPLISLGLPRTGSTALGCMLAEDPNVRFIRTWEAQAPCPPPEAATQFTDPRIAAAHRVLQKRHAMFPRKITMLPGSATSPSECQTFMAYDFKSQLFQALWQVPRYAEWLSYQADLTPTYEYVKRVLKLLQWRCPPTRWRLRNPSHIVFIDALDKVFPDARYCMTHRDVGNVIPSVADLYYELMRASSDQVDKAYLGALNTSWCKLGLQRLIAFRDAGNDHRFFDIHFAPFQRDPFPAIEQLYRFLGEELTHDARARMNAWRDDTPRDKHGEHSYDAADFKIDPAQLRKEFRFYTDRFGVAVAS